MMGFRVSTVTETEKETGLIPFYPRRYVLLFFFFYS